MPSTVPPKTLSEALVALQAQLPRIPKSDEAQVGTRTYRYANLATITDLLMPIMAGLGLAFTCCPSVNGSGQFVLDYQLLHVSGDSYAGQYPLPTSGSPQQIGSAITYARRYALTAVTGIAPADDDDDAVEAERKADRSNNPADAAPWTDQPAGDWSPATPEDKPGSSNSRQHQRLGILYQQIGITDRDDRLTDVANRVERKVTSAKDLSYVEAEEIIAQLSDMTAKAAN